MIKTILLRILIYPICAMIFWLSWKMTFEPAHYENTIHSTKALFYGPFGIIVSLLYPITDALILIKRISKKKSNNDNTK